MVPTSIGAIAALVGGGETRATVTRADASDGTQPTDGSETHTFGEVGGEILVEFVKVGFGDDDRIQRGVISTLVWGTPELERAVLIAGDSRVGGRGWRGGRAGSTRRPFHGVHSAS